MFPGRSPQPETTGAGSSAWPTAASSCRSACSTPAGPAAWPTSSPPIAYAASHGVHIVNESLGSDSYSRAERDAIAASSNTLFVVAAGNGGGDGVGDDVDQTQEYPCAYNLPNVVCVAATDSSDQLASFSNFGTAAVDIAAPG